MPRILKKKKISIDDIAAITGVSRGTVSRAFNQRSDISKTTRALILETAKKLNYLPNSSARGLAKGRSECIGIVVPDIHNPFLAEMVTELEKTIRGRGLTVTLAIVGGDAALQEKILMHMAAGAVDGIIITPCESPESIRQLNWINSRVPVVALKNLEGLDCDTVSSNDRMAIQLVVHHLAEKGHRRIVLVAPNAPEHSVAMRRAAFLDALDDEKLEYRRGLSYDRDLDKLADELADLRKKDKVTAVMAYDDIIAMQLIRCLMERGVKVPRDLAVSGIDNISFGELGIVSLTSAAADMNRLSSTAADILEERIAGNRAEVRCVVLKPTLHVRESTQG